jgi:hypothetical protein
MSANPFGLLVQAHPNDAIAGGTPRRHGERSRLAAMLRDLLAQAASRVRAIAARGRDAAAR